MRDETTLDELPSNPICPRKRNEKAKIYMKSFSRSVGKKSDFVAAVTKTSFGGASIDSGDAEKTRSIRKDEKMSKGYVLGK